MGHLPPRQASESAKVRKRRQAVAVPASGHLARWAGGVKQPGTEWRRKLQSQARRFKTGSRRRAR